MSLDCKRPLKYPKLANLAIALKIHKISPTNFLKTESIIKNKKSIDIKNTKTTDHYNS